MPAAFRSPLRRSRLPSLFAAGAFFGSMAMASTASAVISGIDGNTNKPIAGVGHRCGDCHKGGTAPTVAFAGPASLNAGQTGSYTLTVNTASLRVGSAVAVTPDVTDGAANVVTLIPGTNMQQKFNEVVHASPPPAASGGKAVFSFSFVAPKYGGTVKLWGVGLATNKNGNDTGDADQLTTMNVTIVGPAPGGDAGTGSDSGTFVPGDGGKTDGGGTTPGTDGGGTIGGDGGGKASGDGSTDNPDETLPGNDTGGCTVAAIGTSSIDGGALGASLVAMLGLFTASFARRRRS
jgi:hypothetical protein